MDGERHSSSDSSRMKEIWRRMESVLNETSRERKVGGSSSTLPVALLSCRRLFSFGRPASLEVASWHCIAHVASMSPYERSASRGGTASRSAEGSDPYDGESPSEICGAMGGGADAI